MQHVALDTPAQRAELIGYFPGLRRDGKFKILSPKNVVYNCIAWAMGYTDRWVDIFTNQAGHWWPPGAKQTLEPASLIDAFIKEGFSLSDSEKYEEDYDKVVLYWHNDEWAHASKVLPDDTQYSKFGSLWDAIHSPNIFIGSAYGTAYAFMKRPSAYKARGQKPQGRIIQINPLPKWQ